jgi:excisionase family DNA binding protein
MNLDGTASIEKQGTGARNTQKSLRVSPGGHEPPQWAGWPEVLTLGEAAAYLRVPEAELERLAGRLGLPARQIGSEWRFSRSAIQEWLRHPSMKESLLRLAGSWRDDPHLDEMLAEIYRRRGRSMTEGAQ